MDFEATAVRVRAPTPAVATPSLPFTEIICDPNVCQQDIHIDDDDLLDATDQLPPEASSAAGMMMFQLQQQQQQRQRLQQQQQQQSNFRRRVPAHSQSADSFTLGTGGSSHHNPNRPLRRTLKREAQASYGPGHTRTAPRRSFSNYSATQPPCPSLSANLSRAGQSRDASMDVSFAEHSGMTSSIPSTHLAVQYMQGMRRLSRSIRQTEMTRTALRRSLRQTPSAHSLPPEMTQGSSFSGRSHHTPPEDHHHHHHQGHANVHTISPESNSKLLEDDTRNHVLSLAHQWVPPEESAEDTMEEEGYAAATPPVAVPSFAPAQPQILSQQHPMMVTEHSSPVPQPQRGGLNHYHSGPLFGMTTPMMQT